MGLGNLGIYGGLGQLGTSNKVNGPKDTGLLPNLVSYWSLDETTGPAIDLHGGYTLTGVNNPTYDIGKVYPNARKFIKTSSQYFYRAHGPENSIANKDFTFAFWFKKYLTEYMETVTYLNADIANGYFFSTSVNFKSKITQFRAAEASAEQEAPSNDWSFFVGGCNTITQKVFCSVNGGPVSIGTGTAHRITIDTLHQFRIGRRGSAGSYFFTGLIGPVMFWRSDPGGGGVLTQELITKLYNNGNGLAYSAF